MTLSGAKDKLKQETTSEEIKPWIRRFGRMGRMVKGTIYSLVGILAFMAALEIGGKTTDTTGMLQSLASIPLGEVLLWLIGSGLIGHVIWMLVRAIKDPERKGHHLKGVFSRLGYAISAGIYAIIAINAIQIATHVNSGSASPETISSRILSQPLGRWLIGLFGIIVTGYAVYQFYYGCKEKFIKKFATDEMSKKERQTVKIAGVVGVFSRGIIFSIIGYFFIRTAVTTDPDNATGLDGALTKIANQPFGQWLLGIVAAGLILYGIYQIFRGYYEKTNFGK